MGKDTNIFNKLVDKLKDLGYDVKVEKDTLYDFAIVTGNNIRAGFCSMHDPDNMGASYSYINGKISADNDECFNKWSDCALELTLPESEMELNFLLEKLKYLGTDEAAYESNSFELCIDEYI